MNTSIPIAYQYFVHLFNRLKWAVAVFDDIGMAKMQVCSEEYSHPILISQWVVLHAGSD
jgi:hypothetical protein